MIKTIFYTTFFLWIFSSVLADASCTTKTNNTIYEYDVACLDVRLHGNLSLEPPSNLPSLEYITLILNGVSGQLSNKTFIDFPPVRFLKIFRCNLNEFTPDFRILENLDVSRSFLNISTLDKFHANLEKLSFRHVTGIDFQSSPFTKLNRLKQLRLSYVDVKFLTRNIFAGLASLRKLRLTELNLEKIEDDAFANLKKLKELFIEDNNLLYVGQNVFKPLKGLSSLTIYGKKMDTLSLEMFNEQKNLYQLGLPLKTWRHVDIQKIPRMFPKLNALSYISDWGEEEREYFENLFRKLNVLLVYKNSIV